MEIINVAMEKASSIHEIIDCNKKEEPSVPLISNGLNYSTLPQQYIRPPTERPSLDEVILSSDSIPLVDIQALLCESTRPEAIQQIQEMKIMEKASLTDEMMDCNDKEKLPERSVPLISNGVNYCEVPPQYVRPPSERPRLDEVILSSNSIPLVDIQALLCESTRPEAIQQIGWACAEYGFFQIINHGIPDVVSRKMLEVGEEFFLMPVENRMEYYSSDPFTKTRVCTSFNFQKEQVFNWRDYLRHHCYPLEDHVHTWPSKPAHYREVASLYCKEVRAVVLRLLEAISESLGLESEFLDKAIGKHEQHMSINYYPKCPNPELTFGLPAHSDPTVITLLLQDEVPGLQVLKNGHWIAVNPIPNSFVINIGDQIQVMSNGRYKSVLHRAVVSSSKARISIPTFYFPSPNAVIDPAPALIDDEHPALFRSFTYAEYYQKFWSGQLQGNTCLQSFSHDPHTVEPSTHEERGDLWKPGGIKLEVDKGHQNISLVG